MKLHLSRKYDLRILDNQVYGNYMMDHIRNVSRTEYIYIGNTHIYKFQLSRIA